MQNIVPRQTPKAPGVHRDRLLSLLPPPIHPPELLEYMSLPSSSRRFLFPVEWAAQDLSRQLAAHPPVFLYHGTVNDRVMHTVGTLDQPLASRRIVVGPFRLVGIHRVRIEDRQIRRIARPQKTAIL